MFLPIISCWQGSAYNRVGQVLPVKLSTLKEWRLDINGVNSCSFLAASSSSVRSFSLLVHKNATLAAQLLLIH